LPTDPSFQFDISVRLATAAFFGAVLGFEREVHGHQAGMRTHMLVALGSAIFTVLSIYGFPAALGQGASDPSRISAQIVTGIGFLGAGAILKYGTNIRGLTTAASLWVVAAVGLAAGAGAYFVAAFGSTLAVLALWPLHSLVARLELAAKRVVRIQLALARLDSFGSVSQVLLANDAQIVSVQTRKIKGGHEVELEARLPRAGIDHKVMAQLNALPNVEVESITRVEEA
jgi:putative Mg2+ transporter-C (MgtC) family protein